MVKSISLKPKKSFAELEQAIKDLSGEDMPDDDTKQLVIDALQAAARQVIEATVMWLLIILKHTKPPIWGLFVVC